MTPEVRFILCADDYGQNSAISAAIVDLALQGRLSATSAMVTSPDWRSDAPLIAALADRVAIGLHLNLTHGAPLGAMPRLAPSGHFPKMQEVILAALTGRLDADEISAEVERQVDAFEVAMGCPPDHVDGHQHVHILPMIRTALLRVLRRRYRGRRILLRVPSDRIYAIMRRPEPAKAALVAGLSAGFTTAALRAGFVVNEGFSGFSDFANRPYAAQFASFVRFPGRRPMVMCHPGKPGFEDDPIADRRPQEYEALRNCAGLERLIWHPKRVPGEALDWFGAGDV